MTVAAARRNVGGMNDMQNARQAARPDCQVLVVGAGPTGLVLAADLLARGVAARIIDKGHGAALETRAVAIHARAMQVLDLMGLADRFIERGQVVRRFTFCPRRQTVTPAADQRCSGCGVGLLDAYQAQQRPPRHTDPRR
jgi:2-polyprenyl-6-methoxyphenol hydroxylase-like FAD-dependent oxidoreductase